MRNVYNPSAPNAVALGEQNIQYYEELVASYLPHPYHRVHWPGVCIARLITDIGAYIRDSLHVVVIIKGRALMAHYSRLYQQLTTYPFDSSAPLTEGGIKEYLQSIQHLKNEEVKNP